MYLSINEIHSETAVINLRYEYAMFIALLIIIVVIGILQNILNIA